MITKVSRTESLFNPKNRRSAKLQLLSFLLVGIHFLLKQATMLQLNNENAIKSFEIIETLMNYSRSRPPSLEELAEAKKGNAHV